MMSNEIQKTERKSIIATMAAKFHMEPANFEQVVKNTIMPAGKENSIKNEEFAAFLLVAKEYNLNPMTKEIYAFPGKGGGISPIVSIDGWLRIINEHPQLDGIEFTDNFSGEKLVSITCKIYRKDRQKPVELTEYLEECKGDTIPWRKWPMRMLRHKALIQCARYAFGFSGIYDKDEAERIQNTIDVTPTVQAAEPVTDSTEGLIATLSRKKEESKND